jgi:hypothetical protein
VQIKRIYDKSEKGTAKWLINGKGFKGTGAGRHNWAKFTVESKQFVRSKT